jgi:DNA polymerase-3 subunit epsilon/CBS domain-containing protein
VFRGLVPHLRDKGVHTFAEALAACRKIDALGQQLAGAGWAEAPTPATLREDRPERPETQRFDSYPYRARVADLMSAPPLFLAGDATLDAALKLMAARKVSSLFIGEAAARPDAVGILTERDVLRALAQGGPAALGQPAARFASRPLAAIPAGAYAYRAIGRMARRGFRHLAVVGEDESRVVGALSQRDLPRLRAGAAIDLGDEIDHARDAGDLARAWARLSAMAKALSDEGLTGREIAGVIARELGALHRRAAVLAEDAMAKAGRGVAPCAYGLVVLGSAGRGESLLAMDQDNAIVFEIGEPDGGTDLWFRDMARIMVDLLHAVGVPRCKGGVMASEPAFRGSVETWRKRMATWLTRSSPEDLLNVDIVFDARTVHGDPGLFGALIADFRAGAAAEPAFLKLLVASHGAGGSPVGFFGGLKGDAEGRLDLKRHVLGKVVAAARVLALRRGVAERSTAGRLTALREALPNAAADLARLEGAQGRALDLMLKVQLDDIASGRQPTSAVPLKRLKGDAEEALKADIAHLADVPEMVRDLLY